jgi:hypothetical protein
MLEEIILSGAVPRNVSVLRAELRLDHNVKNRRFLLSVSPSRYATKIKRKNAANLLKAHGYRICCDKSIQWFDKS